MSVCILTNRAYVLGKQRAIFIAKCRLQVLGRKSKIRKLNRTSCRLLVLAKRQWL